MRFKITGHELTDSGHQRPLRATGYEREVAGRLKSFVEAGDVTGFTIGAGEQGALAVSLVVADEALKQRVEAALIGFPKQFFVLKPVTSRN